MPPTSEPIRESYRSDKSIQWVKVHRLADFVYFNHSIHVNKGVGCSSCHGQINQMPLVFQANTLLMQWCVECHRNPERVLRPKDQVFNMDWKAPDNQAEVGAKLRKNTRFGQRPSSPVARPVIANGRMREHEQHETSTVGDDHNDPAGDAKPYDGPMDWPPYAPSSNRNRQAILAHA